MNKFMQMAIKDGEEKRKTGDHPWFLPSGQVKTPIGRVTVRFIFTQGRSNINRPTSFKQSWTLNGEIISKANLEKQLNEIKFDEVVF